MSKPKAQPKAKPSTDLVDYGLERMVIELQNGVAQDLEKVVSAWAMSHANNAVTVGQLRILTAMLGSYGSGAVTDVSRKIKGAMMDVARDAASFGDVPEVPEI